MITTAGLATDPYSYYLERPWSSGRRLVWYLPGFDDF